MPDPSANTPLTEDEWKQLIRDECGEPDDNDPAIVVAFQAVEKSTSLYWRMYADKQSQGSRIRYMYTKRKVLELLLGHMWQAVTNSDSDVSESLSDLYEHLKGIKDDLDATLLGLQANRAATGIVSGVMYTKSPIEVPQGHVDPSDRVYRGDPLRRQWRLNRGD